MTLDGLAQLEDRPGIYLHVPFCSAICPYCDFAVTVGGADKRARFVAALVREAGLRPASERRIYAGADTVYLGGGTPSLLQDDELGRVLDTVRSTLEPAESFKLFLEANPEDVSAESVAAWRALGVDFLSLGVQSFSDAALAFLGRRHRAAGARRAVETALGAGFETVSVDLIYGWPGQDLEAWRTDLETAVELGPHHLSCYELEVHQRTVFGKQARRGELVPQSSDARAELFFATHRVLADRGYPAYEVSNFARPGHRSRHNRKYWRHVPYLGLGPSAHSFDGRRRFWNERHVARWQRRLDSDGTAVAGHELLGRQDLLLEKLMLGLRTREGVDLAVLRADFGYDLVERDRSLVARYVDEGLLEPPDGRLRPTLRGFAMADAIAGTFDLPERVENRR